MTQDFENQTALITGAAKGIGRAVAIALAERGARVVVADLDLAGAQSVADEIGETAIALQVDVANEPSVLAAFDQIKRVFGGLCILVANAGIYPHIPLEETSLDDWRKVVDVNLTGAFLCNRQAFGLMKAQGYGRIVNIASEVFYSGLAKTSAYTAAKGGVVGLTRVAASEGAQHGICVNAVAPGLIETPGVLSQIGEHFDDVLPIQAIQRRGQADDIVHAVLWLASSQASFVTGQTISVNGGSTYR